MSVLTIEASQSYKVIVGKDILPQIGSEVKKLYPHSAAAIITDDIVDGLYGDIVRQSLREQGITVETFVFPNGEDAKNIHTLHNIWEFMAAKELTRSDVVLALGGGVVGDITGFAAGTYLRGIGYIQVPTTFLAAVDSSVGGKTAINLEVGKNLAGAFYQPAMVYCDYQTMRTMEPERFNDGTAEAIKYGILNDINLFNTLAQGDIWDNMEDIILTCLKIKRDLVKADEFDTGLRQLLNLGHTIGHAIEKESKFAITHGHAVAIGMALITETAEAQGICCPNAGAMVKKALINNSLPTISPYPMTALIEAMKRDKKRKGDTITFVIPEKIGKCKLHPVKIDALEDFLAPIGGQYEH